MPQWAGEIGGRGRVFLVLSALKIPQPWAVLGMSSKWHSE